MSSPVTPSDVLVTGATGRVGRHVVDGLLAAGHHPRVLTRQPDSSPFGDHVDVRAGDLTDPSGLGEAFTGIRRLYLFPTGDLPAALQLARDAGVEHVVLLSSASVTYHEPDHSSRHHQAAEDAVTVSGLTHTLLRPGAFMANDLAWQPEITTRGSVSTAYPDAASAPIDERDIAAVAVAALTDPAQVPHIVEMTGPQSLTQRDRVALLATATGRPITLYELTPEQARQQMSQYLPTTAVELILGVLAKSPTIAGTRPAPSTLLHRDPHTYFEWAKRHLT